MTDFPPLHHVAVTVNDLSVSVPWYKRLLGSEPVLDEDTPAGFHHTVFALPGGTLFGLHQHVEGRAQHGRASEFVTGLDHVSFGVPDRSALEEWSRRLDELGIEHGEIVDASYGSGLGFRDPDNIPLEFFAPPGA